jgi:cell division inhibitor SepF
MPGAMHRMGVYLGLVEDDEYEDVDGYGPSAERAPAARRDDYAEPRYARGEVMERSEYAAREPSGRDHGRDYAGRDYVEDKAPRYVEDHGGQSGYQITALHPRTYNEARTIGEHFRKNTPVIMNLSDMDDADAKRLVDFAAGLTFGLHGRIERVTAKVFLLSPHNVTVTAQDKAKIESGFFNQS